VTVWEPYVHLVTRYPATSTLVAAEDSEQIDDASRADAGAIAVGSRGLGGFGSLLLGSVSHALLQQADRPVVIVPSPKVAQKRNEHRRRTGDDAA
jgi:nucleotide-binding universal stress UspA family protein